MAYRGRKAISQGTRRGSNTIFERKCSSLCECRQIFATPIVGTVALQLGHKPVRRPQCGMITPVRPGGSASDRGKCGLGFLGTAETRACFHSCGKVPPHPTVDGKQIQRVTSFKLLGVHISADLTWDAHVQHMLSKTRPRIYYLAAARKAGLPPDVLTQIYLSFIRPILEYASPVWGGLPIRLTHILEGVQKRCCRIMGIPTNSLPTLASRRDQATLRVFRSILDDKDNPLNCFISCPLRSGYDLRRVRHVMTSRSRTKRHEQSFFPRAIKLYNMS
ncbi:hypothetical protein Bbelb_143170 [Branchiostoma belcheri]|nr:hypothetical protein Bbelb_143170 [Branchiostoma belcheri]